MSNVIVCASEDVKAVIYSVVETSQMGDEVKAAIYSELEALPACEGLLPVDFEEAGKAGGKGERKKRKPSGYNLFVSECMVEGGVKSFEAAGPRMKECGELWKKGGEKLKKEYDEKVAKIQSGEGTA